MLFRQPRKIKMQYLLKNAFLKNLCSHQYDEFVNSLNGVPHDEEGFHISFTDKNYRCEPMLDIIADSNIHAISFFSGCGGLDIGVQMAGVKVISTLDFEPTTIETVRSNKFFCFAEHNCADIRNVTGKDYIDLLHRSNPEKLILVGGPPCQPFSKAGYWITNEKRKGIADERNMVGEYLRIIEEIQPDGFLLENVESILHPTNRVAVDYIEENITRMGYHFVRILANALEYGVPQKRKRVFFLASKKQINGAPTKLSPEQVKRVNVLDWIGRFDKPQLAEIEESTEGKTYDFELSEIPPGHNYIALSARDNYPNPKFVANKRFWNFLLKLHPLLPSWTIAAQPGPWVGPFHWNNRRLRAQEVAAIQTFPMDYKIVGSRRLIQKQIGNAVPSLLAEQFVKHLIKFL